MIEAPGVVIETENHPGRAAAHARLRRRRMSGGDPYPTSSVDRDRFKLSGDRGVVLVDVRGVDHPEQSVGQR